MLFRADDTVIHKLRASCPSGERLKQLWRLERALAVAVPRPDRFPSSAIIYMRKLRVLDPGQRDLAGAWSQAVQGEMNRLLSQAARPAQGAVPATATAVWFLDRAEWLACLARDWLHGQLSLHWWWQTLLQPGDQETAVVSAWQEAPTFIPVALDRLDEWSEVVPFVRRLPEAGIRTLLDSLGRVFALPPAVALDQLDIESEPAIPADPERRHATPSTAPLEIDDPLFSNERRTGIVHSPFASPPWAGVVPECAADGLSKTETMFIALGLMLRRRPLLLHQPRHLAALQRWWITPAAAGPTILEPKTLSAPPPAADIPLAREEPHIGALSSQVVPPPTGQAAVRPAIASPVAAVPLEAASAKTRPSAAQAISFEPPGSRGAAATDAAPPVPDLDLQIWHTRWGGLFYLANLLLYLELYHDLGHCSGSDLALPFWDFMALLGRRLIGPQLESDPLWELLALCSGRAQDEEPGLTFQPPDTWQVPQTWLAPFAASGWLWDLDDQRLRVWHPAGFWLADLPHQGRSLAEWQAELNDGQIDPHPLQGTCPQADGQSPLARWLDWQIAYMRARLRLALGLDKETDLARFLLQHDARLTDSGSEIDIAFSLASLPIAVRYAGLDRDPGWIPASGRRLAFFYESGTYSGNPIHGAPTLS